MKCTCGSEATVEHFRQSPQCATEVQSLWALCLRARRTTVTRAGGRPPEMVKCPRCGEPVTKTQARRGHGCAVVAGNIEEGKQA